MRKFLIGALAALAFAHGAMAADSTVSSMPAAAALDGTEFYYGVQGGADKKVTGAQIKTYANSSGVVTSVATSCGATGGPITTTGTISAAIVPRTVSGTTDTVLSTDCGNLVNYTSASSVAVTLPQSGTAGFGANTFFTFCAQGAGTVTITPTTSTIGGAANKALSGGSASSPVCITAISDGTNYQIIPAGGSGAPTGSAGGDLSGTYPNPTVQKANGNSIPSGAAAHQTIVGTAANTFSLKTIPDCQDTGGNHINFTQSTDSFSCGTTSSGGSSNGAWYASYQANNWYAPFPNTGMVSGAALAANTIRCTYALIPQKVTIDSMAIRVTTGGTNAAVGIYTNGSNGRPATLIGNTANINAASVSVDTALIQVATVNTPIQVGPGGAQGDKELWFCLNSDNAAMVLTAPTTANTSSGLMVGSTTASDVLGTNTSITGITCAASCQGGTPTFGTPPYQFPASLATTTWTISSAGTNNQGIVIFRASSVP